MKFSFKACLLAIAALFLISCTSPLLTYYDVDKIGASEYAIILDEATDDGILNSNKALGDRVKAISAKLIDKAMEFKEQSKSWPWQVNVINNDTVNALCLPGGRIVVYAGLIEKLSLTDDELAFVIAHEMSHALLEHRRQILNQDILERNFISFEDLDETLHKELLNGHKSTDRALHMSTDFVQMEAECDRLGLYLMFKAGFDGSAASVFWHKMLSIDAKKRDARATHPKDGDRAAALEIFTSKLKSEPDLKLSMDDFK